MGSDLSKWSEERYERLKKVVGTEVADYLEDGMKDEKFQSEHSAKEGVAILMADVLTILGMNLSFVCGFFCDFSDVTISEYPAKVDLILGSIKKTMTEDYKDTLIKALGTDTKSDKENKKKGGDYK